MLLPINCFASVVVVVDVTRGQTCSFFLVPVPKLLLYYFFRLLLFSSCGNFWCEIARQRIFCMEDDSLFCIEYGIWMSERDGHDPTKAILLFNL